MMKFLYALMIVLNLASPNMSRAAPGNSLTNQVGQKNPHLSFAGKVLKGLALFAPLLHPHGVGAQSVGNSTAMGPCSRYPEGGLITQPVNLTPQIDPVTGTGVLNTTFLYEDGMDDAGNPTRCYTAGPNHQQSPMIRINPGDQVQIALQNTLSLGTMNMPAEFPPGTSPCGSANMDENSVNLHFIHGGEIPPTPGQDSVFCSVQGGQPAFNYNYSFPKTFVPGEYSYHFHVHGITESALLAGSSGLFIVEGIENYRPEVAGLPERILIIRDTLLSGNYTELEGPQVPFQDLMIDFTPIRYPNYNPPYMVMKPNEKQFFRVAALTADSSLNVQYQVDGVPQPITIVALDGYPVTTPYNVTQIPLPTLARAGFILTTPSVEQNASLVTLGMYMGVDGDNNPPRPLLNIQLDNNAPAPEHVIPTPTASTPLLVNDTNMRTAAVTQSVVLNFNETSFNPDLPELGTQFFLTPEGQQQAIFDAANKPSLVVCQGSVLEFLVQNQFSESHVFHSHQKHFLVTEINGTAATAEQSQVRDTILVESADDPSLPYPSFKGRMSMDIVGVSIFQCHLAEHLDGGMMMTIQTIPADQCINGIPINNGPPISSSGVQQGGSSSSSKFDKIGVPVIATVGGVAVLGGVGVALYQYWDQISEKTKSWWNSSHHQEAAPKKLNEIKPSSDEGDIEMGAVAH